MATSSRIKGPQTGVTIPHKIILTVVDYKAKTTINYRVTSYRTLEALMRLQGTAERIRLIDKAAEMKLREEMKTFWENGLRMTEDTHKPDFTYILELHYD